MILKNAFYISLLSILFFCCKQKDKGICEQEQFKQMDLRIVNTKINIPSGVVLIDTLVYKPSRTVLNYKFETPDSTFTAIVFVDNYDDYSTEEINIDRITTLQKNEIESGLNSKKMLAQKVKDIESVKVSYLKYLVEQPNEKFYSARIFFYREKKLVILWLFEKYTTEDKNKHSVIDCIFENIQLN